MHSVISLTFVRGVIDTSCMSPVTYSPVEKESASACIRIKTPLTFRRTFDEIVSASYFLIGFLAVEFNVLYPR